jgi:hypothetical protein
MAPVTDSECGSSLPMPASAPLPQDRVGLTVAGLSRVAGAEHIVDSFLRFVGAMGTIRARVQLDPCAQTRPTVTRAEIVIITGELSLDDGSLLE